MPPGSYGPPIVGETLAWRRDRLEFLRRRYERYGRIFKSRTYGYREITMLGPEANEFILSSHRHHFEWAGGHELFFHRRLFRQNIFLMDAEEHAHHRKLILPAFHGRAIRGYFEVMRNSAEEYAQRWAATGRIRAFPEMRALTFDIASQLLLGAGTGRQTRHLSGLFDTLSRGMTAFPRWDIPVTRYGKARRAVDRIARFIRATLDDRRRQGGTDVLARLATAEDEEGNRLSDDAIVSHLITLVIAAHDTTTSSLTWLLYELDRRPEVLERVIEELAGVCDGAPLAVEHMAELKYLDRVLKEVERLHPAVSGAPRRVVKAFEFDGYHVPEGAIVWYSTIFTHRMPEVFADPDVFDPDRFAPPRSEDVRTPFGLVGFGGGPRACIGRGFARMEMKAIVAAILSGYRWRVESDPDVRADYTPTKRPKDGLRVAFYSARADGSPAV